MSVVTLQAHSEGENGGPNYTRSVSAGQTRDFVSLASEHSTFSQAIPTFAAPPPEIDNNAMKYLQQSFGDVTQRRLMPVNTFRGSFRCSPDSLHLRLPSLIQRQSSANQKNLWLLQTSAAANDLQSELSKVGSWDEFDVFKVQKLSSNRPLEAVSLALFRELRLIEKLNLPLDKLQAYFQALEAAYNNKNIYHNSTHASDVTQTVGAFLLTDTELLEALSDLEVLALVLSAIMHDTGHPGLTNDFQIKTRSDAAIIYNDQSVNENLHLAKSFQILLKPEHNFLAHLSDEDFRTVRSAIIAIVLATDMSIHSQLAKDFAALVDTHGPNFPLWRGPARLKALQFLVHCADISNILKPTELSVQWSEMVLNEMWAQGDREQSLGMAISPLCDRANTNIPKSQIGFLEFVVKPSFELLSVLIPKTSELGLEYGAANRMHYEAILAEERNAFR